MPDVGFVVIDAYQIEDVLDFVYLQLVQARDQYAEQGEVDSRPDAQQGEPVLVLALSHLLEPEAGDEASRVGEGLGHLGVPWHTAQSC